MRCPAEHFDEYAHLAVMRQQQVVVTTVILWWLLVRIQKPTLLKVMFLTWAGVLLVRLAFASVCCWNSYKRYRRCLWKGWDSRTLEIFNVDFHFLWAFIGSFSAPNYPYWTMCEFRYRNMNTFTTSFFTILLCAASSLAMRSVVLPDSGSIRASHRTRSGLNSLLYCYLSLTPTQRYSWLLRPASLSLSDVHSGLTALFFDYDHNINVPLLNDQNIKSFWRTPSQL